MKNSILFVLLLSFLLATTSLVRAEGWKIVEGKIVTPFAKDVDPAKPLPEYPRPQMERETWLNLNGLWGYAIRKKDAKFDNKCDGEILVPYPIESALSGVGKNVGKDNRLFYKKEFTVPTGKEWTGKRILLHFGAVDWDATVFVNGKEVGKHVGGYAPFSFDITDALKSEGSQTLVVSVWDPTTDGYQPVGKQHNNPHGIWYTPVTGIWQTVWLEPVPVASIKQIKLTPDLKGNTIKVETVVQDATAGARIEAKASFKNTEIKQQRNSIGPLNRRGNRRNARNRGEIDNFSLAASVGSPLVLDIPNPQLWTPDTPNLYDLEVSLIRQDGTIIDSVKSYFGMRDVSLGKCERGHTRMMLNGKFLFQHGPLDQGWWPDGLYTAPTDEALAYDIAVTKNLGYNMLRKHVKVEPARFYYHCDRLGMIVWQDMPSGDPKHYIPMTAKEDAPRSPESKANFEREWKEIIESFYNAPSIIVWVPFNEGWGQYDTCRILDWTKKLDPTRLVDGPSGWTDRGCGDLYDMHKYRGPGMFPPEEKRASVLGEYGGLGLPVAGHTWVESDKNWGYGGNLKDRNDLMNTYQQLNDRLHTLIPKGLSAAIYTQTTDVEVEVNGLMTYDRKVIKVDVDKFKASNDALRLPAPETKTLLPTVMDEVIEWSYTTEKPADGWEKANFDDTAWKRGKAGFGTEETPGAKVGTVWNTENIWIRRSFDLTERDVKDVSRLVLNVFHDEDAEIYINGVEVLKVRRWNGSHDPFIPMNAKEAFKVGTNVIAVHCKQTTGGQFIDVGISRIVPFTGGVLSY